MSSSKQFARKFIFPLMMGLKLDRLIRSRSKNSLLNLMYHGVVKQDSNYFSSRHLTAEQFEKHLIYLKNNFDIITLSDAFDRIRNKQKLNNKTITISFDDGYLNNLTNALPLLEKHQIPATFFIATIGLDSSETPCLWTEYIGALNYFYPNETIQLGDNIFKDGQEIQKHFSLYDFLKKCTWQERDSHLSELNSKFHLYEKLETLPQEIWKLMNLTELTLFAQSKFVSIASHTHNHYNLANISIDKAREEMQKSKQLLETSLGIKITSIAFPDGSYSPEVKDIAQEIGYTNQMAVTYKFKNDKLDSKIMNRHGISSTTTFESNMLLLNKSFATKGIKI